MTAEDLAGTFEDFHDLHESTHTFASRDEEPVLRAVRLQAVGATWKPALAAAERKGTKIADALMGERAAFFDDGFVATPVYDGDRIGFGHVLEGPAIVEERFTTIVLNPGDRAELDASGNYVIEVAD